MSAAGCHLCFSKQSGRESAKTAEVTVTAKPFRHAHKFDCQGLAPSSPNLETFWGTSSLTTSKMSSRIA
eukprot:2594748-Amphidinium_carterae.1